MAQITLCAGPVLILVFFIFFVFVFRGAGGAGVPAAVAMSAAAAALALIFYLLPYDKYNRRYGAYPYNAGNYNRCQHMSP